MEARFAVDIGLDVSKIGHHACALNRDRARQRDEPLVQDEAGQSEAACCRRCLSPDGRVSRG